jgi:tetratricopeptide (TPR) repeat protein
MELVKGLPITKYCDEHRLTPKERLELFVPVCQAIQHAHQKGIIHRDIKPSNVLVGLYDGRPVPKVIDFGVAKATGQRLTDKTLFTEFGSIVGTPEYMSPEQAELNNQDIDTRSDIYSLGVLLYELLTGTTPLERKRLQEVAVLELLRLVREEEAPRPSTRLSTAEGLPSIAANRGTERKKLTGLMRGELDWIVLKALEKDRDRRYETAKGLAADVLHYLHDEPVQACPPSASYRLRKFVRRNKGPALAAILLVLVLLAGIIGTSFGMIRAGQARNQEEQQRIAAENSAKEARDREAETNAVLDFVETKILAAARPEALDGGQGYDVKLADAVKAALPYVEKSFTAQPLIEARLRMTMGSSYWYLGDATTASRQFQAARELYTQHLGSDHPNTLRSMINLAAAYADLGHDQEALKLYEETLRLQKTKLGPDHPDTLASMNNLANSYGDVGSIREALELNEATLQLRKAKLGPHLPQTLKSMQNLAISYLDTGRTQEALKLLEETVELTKAERGPDHPDTLGSMLNLANCYRQAGRTQEALKLNEQTLQLYKSKLGPDHPSTLHTMNNLANSYDAVGRKQEALKLYEETLQLRKTKLGPDHPDTLTSMNNLGAALLSQGKWSDAIAWFRKAIALDPKNARYHDNLGAALGRQGKHNDAIACFHKALALDPNYAPAHYNLGTAFATQGNRDNAIACFRKALALDPKYADAHNNLAWQGATSVDPKLRDPKQAVLSAKRAVALDPSQRNYWNTLGAAHYAAGDWKACVEALARSMELGGGGDANDWFFLAMARWQLGDKQDARKWFDQAVQWMEKNQPMDEELIRFRAEAEELLGIAKQVNPEPELVPPPKVVGHD